MCGGGGIRQLSKQRMSKYRYSQLFRQLSKQRHVETAKRQNNGMPRANTLQVKAPGVFKKISGYAHLAKGRVVYAIMVSCDKKVYLINVQALIE